MGSRSQNQEEADKEDEGEWRRTMGRRVKTEEEDAKNGEGGWKKRMDEDED